MDELLIPTEDQDFHQIEKSEFEQFCKMMQDHQTHMSFSGFRNFIPITGGSPYGFMKYKLRKKKATKAMDLGSLIDALILTPWEKEETFVTIPSNCNFNSLAGIAAYAEFLKVPTSLEGLKMNDQKAVVMPHLEALKSEKIVVSSSDIDLAERIANRVKLNDYSSLFTNRLDDKSVQVNVNFKAFGWDWRGKMDAMLERAPKYQDGVIIDFKLVPDATPKRAMYTIRENFYSGQAAIYSIGTGLDLPFLNICYDRQGGVSILELPKRTIQDAWNTIDEYMDIFNTLVDIESGVMPEKWYDSHTFWAKKNMGVVLYDL